MIGRVFRFEHAPGISVLHSEWSARRFLACLATILVLTLFLTLCPRAAFPASPEGAEQGAAPSKSGAKSEAAEAWDAVKNTTNPALLEAFIKRYRTTFFADIAKARLDELKAAAAKPPADGVKPIRTLPLHSGPGQKASPIDRFDAPALQMPADGVREHAVLYEEDPSNSMGRQSAGSVIWHTELIKAEGKPDELTARADVEIPSRGLRMTMSLRRNLDTTLPASHVINLTLAVPTDFDGGGIANVPGILMKSNQQARGTPLAALSVKVTNGSFLVGLSSAAADSERNLRQLRLPWFDIPIVYANQRRAILAIEKSTSGEQVFNAVLAAWGQFPTTQPAAAIPERDCCNGSAQ